MSVRAITYYYVSHGNPNWDSLRAAFKNHISKHNVPFFEAESSAEANFLDFCARERLRVEPRRILEYDGKGGGCEFLYFVVKGDKGFCVDQTAEFIDQTYACPGGGSFGLCGKGSRQISKVPVTPLGVAELAKKDILHCDVPTLPSIYLVSERLAKLLESVQATGYSVSDCDVVTSQGEPLSDGCKQLTFTVETAGPARIGHVKVGPRCPVCGRIKGFLAGRERSFQRNDLMPSDFQICKTYYGENVGLFEIAAGFPIISKRILDLLLQERVRGLDRFSSDPPIQHAVVQFEN